MLIVAEADDVVPDLAGEGGPVQVASEGSHVNRVVGGGEVHQGGVSSRRQKIESDETGVADQKRGARRLIEGEDEAEGKVDPSRREVARRHRDLLRRRVAADVDEML